MHVLGEAAALKTRAVSGEQGPSARWYHSPRVQLVLCLALALAIRLLMLARAHGMMDGDEGVLGIQAEQILRGKFPIYYDRQLYMAAWDAYLAAPLIALFGPSAWALHLVDLAESLVFVPLIGSLAAHLYGARARLPAMLLAALPPFFTLVTELHTWGGYVETLVLGTALMLVVVKISQRWAAGQATFTLWLWLGFLTGFAFWIDPLIALYVVGCLFWLGPLALRHLWRGWKQGWAWWRTLALDALACLIALLVGATPTLIYALQNQWSNYRFLIGQQGVHGWRLDEALYLLDTALPHLWGVKQNYTWFPGTKLTTAIALVAGGIIIAACLYTGYVLIRRSPLRRSQRQQAEATALSEWWNYAFAPLLWLAVFLIYWRTSAVGGTFALIATDRYALPDLTALLLMLAAFFANTRLLIEWLRQRPRLRPARLASLPAARLQLLLSGALLVLILGAYFVPYVYADAVEAWKSPYWGYMRFPGDNSDLLTYLETQHIRYIWTNHWVGNVVMYLTDRQVLCYDYVDQVKHSDVIHFPETGAEVAKADRPSFIIDAKPLRGETAVAQALDRLGVTYNVAEFGILRVITPLSRTVQPDEIFAALFTDY